MFTVAFYSAMDGRLLVKNTSFSAEHAAGQAILEFIASLRRLYDPNTAELLQRAFTTARDAREEGGIREAAIDNLYRCMITRNS